eukprot:Platyproteum_vivax@DN16006_c0_g1_i1.p1
MPSLSRVCPLTKGMENVQQLKANIFSATKHWNMKTYQMSAVQLSHSKEADIMQQQPSVCGFRTLRHHESCSFVEGETFCSVKKAHLQIYLIKHFIKFRE